MKVEIYEQRVLVAEEGKWLCNKKAKTISPDGRTYLAINDDGSNWTEITTEEKEALEKEWEEIETE